MASFPVTLCILAVTFIHRTTATAKLTSDLSSITADDAQQIATHACADFAGFFNGQIQNFKKWAQASERLGFTWDSSLITVIDGEEYDNYGAFQRYLNRARAMLETIEITECSKAEIKPSESAMEYYICFEAELKVKVFNFDASHVYTQCGTVRREFEYDSTENIMRVTKIIQNTNGLGSAMFNKAMLYTTTMLPESGAINVSANSLKLVIIFLMVMSVCGIAFIVKFVVSRFCGMETRNKMGKYEKVRVVTESEREFDSEKQELNEQIDIDAI